MLQKYERLHRRFGGKCFYCDRELSLAKSTLDHFIPESRGGRRRSANSVLACKHCNEAKDNFDPRTIGLHTRIPRDAREAEVMENLKSAVRTAVCLGLKLTSSKGRRRADLLTSDATLGVTAAGGEAGE